MKITSHNKPLPYPKSIPTMNNLSIPTMNNLSILCELLYAKLPDKDVVLRDIGIMPTIVQNAALSCIIAHVYQYEQQEREMHDLVSTVNTNYKKWDTLCDNSEHSDIDLSDLELAKTRVDNNQQIKTQITQLTTFMTQHKHEVAQQLQTAGFNYILTTLDKLIISPTINAILKLNIVQPQQQSIATSQIINHVLPSSPYIITAYKNGYNVTYNNRISIRGYDFDDRDLIVGLRDVDGKHAIENRTKYNIATTWENLKVALNNGLHVRSVDKGNMDDATIEIFTALNQLDVQQLVRFPTQPIRCNHLAKTLRILIARSPITMITDASIQSCTVITELYADQNIGITTCAPFAKSLVKLSASGYRCGICDDGLALCTSITELNVDCNRKITTCAPFAKSLITLSAADSAIDDDGLASCTLISNLTINDNNLITTCAPFAKSLEKLSVCCSGTIVHLKNAGLQMCTKIVELDVAYNKIVTSCIPFAKNIRKLVARGSVCAIRDDALHRCVILEYLDASYNEKITTCKPFAKSLTTLYANETCGIGDAGLRSCTLIRHLYADDNPKITRCLPFSDTLYTLSARNSCGITNSEVLLCIILKHIYADGNLKIKRRRA